MRGRCRGGGRPPFLGYGVYEVIRAKGCIARADPPTMLRMVPLPVPGRDNLDQP